MSTESKERVAVTGLGAVTGFGTGCAALWAGLSTGSSAVRRYDLFPSKGFPVAIAAQAPGILTEDRALVLGRTALREALRQASLTDAVSVGLCGAVGWPAWPAKNENGFAHGLDTLAREHNFRGPVLSCLSACAASTQAMGDAVRLLRNGEAAAVAVVGADTRLYPLALLGYHQLGALTTHHREDPARACRPFDRDRAGFVIGEGAGALVLETESKAHARGAKVWGFIRGTASTCDAFRLTDPEPGGVIAARCLEEAITRAGLEPADIGYANLHGTGTPANDRVEVAVLRRVFGEKLGQVPCGSFKSMIGHLSMAAGAVEIIGTLLALRFGVLPPTRNLDHISEDCLGPDWIQNSPRQATPRFALKASYGFGGQNSTVVLEATG
ncbi:MAG: beta-ketoacyl-[acyl-carrier-protein] synthase family protein [Candidatus Methylacidiphilales bacterium]|nr:beta-ketoacyl-[acyl-carrier-protein] synthase family protein [Candidatus Methylacidiphilales bacterium]